MNEPTPYEVPEVLPVPAPVEEAAAPEPEPDYVVVPWEQVDEYKGKGYQVGYVLIKS